MFVRALVTSAVSEDGDQGFFACQSSLLLDFQNTRKLPDQPISDEELTGFIENGCRWRFVSNRGQRAPGFGTLGVGLLIEKPGTDVYPAVCSSTEKNGSVRINREPIQLYRICGC